MADDRRKIQHVFVYQKLGADDTGVDAPIRLEIVAGKCVVRACSFTTLGTPGTTFRIRCPSLTRDDFLSFASDSALYGNDIVHELPKRGAGSGRHNIEFYDTTSATDTLGKPGADVVFMLHLEFRED